MGEGFPVINVREFLVSVKPDHIIMVYHSETEGKLLAAPTSGSKATKCSYPKRTEFWENYNTLHMSVWDIDE
jgi:hypothetical protein